MWAVEGRGEGSSSSAHWQLTSHLQGRNWEALAKDFGDNRSPYELFTAYQNEIIKEYVDPLRARFLCCQVLTWYGTVCRLPSEFTPEEDARLLQAVAVRRTAYRQHVFASR